MLCRSIFFQAWWACSFFHQVSIRFGGSQHKSLFFFRYRIAPFSSLRQNTQDICTRAISQFLDSKSPCSYVDLDSGEKCVNTKSCHRIGHQSASGDLLHDGNFVSGNFNSTLFLLSIRSAFCTTMRAIKSSGPASFSDWRRLAAIYHRNNINALIRVGVIPLHVIKGRGGLQKPCFLLHSRPYTEQKQILPFASAVYWGDLSIVFPANMSFARCVLKTLMILLWMKDIQGGLGIVHASFVFHLRLISGHMKLPSEHRFLDFAYYLLTEEVRGVLLS